MHSNNTFVYPSTGVAGRIANRIIASRTLLRARRALLSRLPFLELASDALPSHLAQRFTHAVRDGHHDTLLSSGGGSAPDFRCSAQASSDRTLPAAFAPFFKDWRDAVASLSLQHAAIAHVEDCDRFASASIDLPIDIDTVQPLKTVGPAGGGDFLARIGATGEPMCFVVPDVAFRVLSERRLSRRAQPVRRAGAHSSASSSSANRPA
ncbi:hypothetical protein [Burkholderia stabilis]|uniref:hypothetical protein n=1 Tax=Burkholderia stabilis TaxID=95485 RepID=UPI001F4A3894|nr:hypothetical protein [Burkholderia stabilis]